MDMQKMQAEQRRGAQNLIAKPGGAVLRVIERLQELARRTART